MAHDPLGCEFPLPLLGKYYPMGIPVHIATNSQSTFWRLPDRVWSRYPVVAGAQPVVLRVMVEDHNTTDRLSPPVPRGQGHLLSIVQGPDNFAVCDLSASFGFARLTHDVAKDSAYVRYHFLETAVYTMIEAQHFCPVHASCVALNGRAAVLCGDSGAGKTSLAYACARLGWTYLADDATYIVRDRRDPTVAGRPFAIRFRAEARALFPELSRYRPERRPNGKLNLEIDTDELGLTVALESKASCLVFLNRKDYPAEARISRFSRADAFQQLSKSICYGDQHTRNAQTQSLGDCVKLPVLELAYSDFDSAETALRGVLTSDI